MVDSAAKHSGNPVIKLTFIEHLLYARQTDAGVLVIKRIKSLVSETAV